MNRADLERRLKNLVKIRRAHGASYYVELAGLPIGSVGWGIAGARRLRRLFLADLLKELWDNDPPLTR